MKKMMIAVAMTTALPAAAFAQATPAPSAAAHSGHAGKDMKAIDCKDMHASMSGGHAGHQMSGSSAQADHSKMDHSKMDHPKMAACGETAKGGASAPADPHANHKQ